MAVETLWYYSNAEGEQAGPVTPEQLQQLATDGTIAPTTSLWAEGLENWVSAGEVEGLFELEETPAPEPTPAPVEAAAVTPVTTTASAAAPAGEATAPAEGYPVLPVKPASYGKFLGFILGGPAVMGLFLAIGTAVVASAEATTPGEDPDTGRALAGLALGLGGYGLGGILFLIGIILGLSYLYRAWDLLKWNMPRTTPGKAVGLLFVPFFNLYWVFVAYRGLAEDWNRTMATYPDLTLAPRLNAGVFLGYCICLVSVVGAAFAPILWLILMADLCRGINFMASRTTMQTRPGGLQFY